jgi:hypothetical protein
MNLMQTKVLRYKKFLREYISFTDEYNEHLITNNLIANETYRPNMVTIRLQELSLGMNPMFPEIQLLEESDLKRQQLTKSIFDFLLLTGEHTAGLRVENFKRLTGMAIKARVKGLTIGIRDFPVEIVKVESLAAVYEYIDIDMVHDPSFRTLVNSSGRDGHQCSHPRVFVITDWL